MNYAQQRFVVSVDLSLCAAGGLDLGGRTVSAWVYFDGPTLPANCCASDPYVYTTDGTSYDPHDVAMVGAGQAVSQQWFKVSATVPTSTSHIVRTLQFFTNLNSDGWTGSVDFDDIAVQ